MHALMHTHMHTHAHTCMHKLSHTYMPTHAHTHKVHTCLHTHTCTITHTCTDDPNDSTPLQPSTCGRTASQRSNPVLGKFSVIHASPQLFKKEQTSPVTGKSIKLVSVWKTRMRQVCVVREQPLLLSPGFHIGGQPQWKSSIKTTPRGQLWGGRGRQIPKAPWPATLG